MANELGIEALSNPRDYNKVKRSLGTGLLRRSHERRFAKRWIRIVVWLRDAATTLKQEGGKTTCKKIRGGS